MQKHHGVQITIKESQNRKQETRKRFKSVLPKLNLFKGGSYEAQINFGNERANDLKCQFDIPLKAK